ncbi:SH3 domain-containing protein [Rutstroemia sp. NJR-2017a BBW]|nr:SH3 domain-containing protein [Rutstroemia sp. NJR-2017a BBW]
MFSPFLPTSETRVSFKGKRRLSGESSTKVRTEVAEISLRRSSTVSYHVNSGEEESLSMDNKRVDMTNPKWLEVDTSARYDHIDSVVNRSSGSNSARSTSAGETTTGLGINFYDHRGQRVQQSPESLRRNEAVEAALGLSPRTQPPSASSSPLSGQAQFPSRLHTPVISQNFEPVTPTSAKSTIDLIDELLEENYRGQADSLYQSSSRASSARHNLSTSASSSAISGTQTSSAYRAFSAPLKININTVNPPSPDTPSLIYTPTRGSKSGLAAHSRVFSLRTPSKGEYGTNENSGFTPDALKSPPYRPQLYQIPSSPTILKRAQRPQPPPLERGRLYFFDYERALIDLSVRRSNRTSCSNHDNCTDCTDKEYAYFENKAMSTQIPPERRQQIMKANRSIRNIKNELENLLEDGMITDEVYELMMSSLPTESGLKDTASPAPRANAVVPAPPTAAFSQMNVSDNPPPAYQNATPNLPPRGPSQPPARPEIARATALYRYTEPEDCNFEVGDTIAIYEYMNDDWWLGKNLRTGKEGVFPTNYVQKHAPPPPGGPGAYGNEKTGYYGAQAPQQYPPPPGPSDPYNSAVPPMQIAEQPTETKPGKGAEMGKKFGKKLGNAAIFGAGATIGGNIVNSIF